VQRALSGVHQTHAVMARRDDFDRVPEAEERTDQRCSGLLAGTARVLPKLAPALAPRLIQPLRACAPAAARSRLPKCLHHHNHALADTRRATAGAAVCGAVGLVALPRLPDGRGSAGRRPDKLQPPAGSAPKNMGRRFFTNGFTQDKTNYARHRAPSPAPPTPSALRHALGAAPTDKARLLGHPLFDREKCERGQIDQAKGRVHQGCAGAQRTGPARGQQPHACSSRPR
jgi:hypothetical protein